MTFPHTIENISRQSIPVPLDIIQINSPMTTPAISGLESHTQTAMTYAALVDEETSIGVIVPVAFYSEAHDNHASWPTL